MSRIGALQLRDAVLDEGSFRSWAAYDDAADEAERKGWFVARRD